MYDDNYTGVPYEEALRDGIIFCKLMNRLRPGIITKINTSGGDYKMMDNLNQVPAGVYAPLIHIRLYAIDSVLPG
ncbi:hypothetical protein G9C98_001938 [Cotesia typhae]|uniref:Calponin-homology (CH) domain-containing protein n=1 Tax=Cotesia typhae TaxID=2053667 RepID=A0A8J5UWM4_9HYME|nr:hypothetical protein G9C98_001938 [Cotesia typhae]